MLERLKKLNALLNTRDRWLFLVVFVVMLGNAAVEAIGVGIVPAFVGAAIDPETFMSYPLVEPVLRYLGITTSRAMLMWGGAGIVVFFLMRSIYMFLAKYVQVRYVQGRELRLTRDLFQLYMHAPYEFHLARNSAELIRNIREEVRNCMTTVRQMIMLLMNLLMTLGIIILLFVAQPRVSVVAFPIFFIAALGFLLITRRKSTAYGNQAREESRKIYKAINQGLGAMKETRVLGRGAHLVDALVRSLRPYMHALRYRRLAQYAANPYLQFLAVAGLMGIGMVLLARGHTPAAIAPALTLFAAAFVRLRATTTKLVGAMTNLYYRLASVEPVYDDMRLLQEQEARAAARATGEGRLPLTNSLRACGVTYSYPNADEDALCDIDLEVEKGSSVAFVGPTGAGKTTLVDVLLGLLEPAEGTVEVDGVDIRTSLRGWQDNIGYIPQEIYLTDDTVRRNVALGLEDDDIAEDRLWQALRAAQIADFVEDLSHSADTVVGERGIRLSGGQKQRIGIARALYHNPDVLVMDEPTSSLDMETERRVVEAINELKGDRTIVIIAHRIATVKRCDRLFFLREGRLDGSGTYEELLEEHDEFRAMAR